ncbi:MULTISPECIES: phosphatidate cytidylyltransferase [unclassified Treponema]|uniref:phosphatidate cytidylyltransferase n=1 Tax=unclassified Treponema TaxID=2638727 RepID=UPI0025F06938|nr:MULTISPECIES: phosphatidate cytidylyltransferase [unclassified Treponema]
MNRKVVSRLGIFFIGVPLIIMLILLNQMNHLAIHIVVTAVSVVAACEFYHILGHNFKLQNKLLVIILAGVINLAMLLRAVFEFDISYVDFVFVLAILISLAVEVILNKTFENSNSHIITSISIITYAGYLLTFLTRMTFLKHSRPVLIMFLTMVFFCDSLAWFFGVLFGKNNKGFIKASPNKSIAGFCGGIFGSILSGILSWFLWKNIFTGSAAKLVLLGALISITSILGDLVESVLKRSADCKDSGSIIPGRGGILDSIDSIVFSAPVFYFTITHIYPALLQ